MRKDLVSASGLPFYSQKYNYELGDTYIIFRLWIFLISAQLLNELQNFQEIKKIKFILGIYFSAFDIKKYSKQSFAVF